MTDSCWTAAAPAKRPALSATALRFHPHFAIVTRQDSQQSTRVIAADEEGTVWVFNVKNKRERPHRCLRTPRLPCSSSSPNMFCRCLARASATHLRAKCTVAGAVMRSTFPAVRRRSEFHRERMQISGDFCRGRLAIGCARIWCISAEACDACPARASVNRMCLRWVSLRAMRPCQRPDDVG